MAEKEKKPIQILRDRHGGMSDQLKSNFKNQNQLRKKLEGALKDGSKTIPQLASDTGIPSGEVMWHVMAMKKYGKILEHERAGDYFKYGLKEGS